MGLKELARQPGPKIGNFIVEFATPGIGHILKAAGLDFAFFDAGDAASNGTITILPPTESTNGIGTCTGSGVVNGTLTGCRITGISAANGWNGKTQHIRVQVPPGYTCTESSAGGCWYRVQVGFGSGTVTDVTTWTAVVEGDPVRLIE